MELKTLPKLALWSLALALPLAACGGDDKGSSDDPCGGRCLPTQVCDVTQCVECTADAHCQALSAEKPVCRMSDNVCVQCVTQSDCSGLGEGLICKNSRCVLDVDPQPEPDAGPQPECTKDEECPGTDVCEKNECQTCRLGTCNDAGDSKCAASIIGGDTHWEPCDSGSCDQGSCEGEAAPRCGDGQINQQSEKCDGDDLGGVTCATVPGESFTGGKLKCTAATCQFDVSECTAETVVDDGIQKARDAITGTDAVTVSIPITNVLVTYDRGDGFFIQASPTGPAIFVNADAGSGTPAAGDKINLTATAVLQNESSRISAYASYAKVSSGNSLTGWRQDLSDVSNITDIDTYESEIFTVSATLTSAFAGSGAVNGVTMKKAQIKTDGYAPATPSNAFVIRVPEAVASAVTSAASALRKTVIGCSVVFEGVYWGYRKNDASDTQLSLYADDANAYVIDCTNAEDDPNAPPTNFDAHESWKGLTAETSSPFSSQDVSGVTWTYTATPYAAASSATRPFSPGFVLPSDKHLTSSAISGGIKELTVAFGKGSNSNDVRCIKVTVNGTTYKSEPFSSTSAVPYTLFKVPNINAAGSASPTIKIEMNGDTADNCKNTQLMIGDIWWTNN